MKPAAIFSIAPMMGYTDRHGRYFLRRLTRFARLYTEMIPAQAILHGDREKLLGFHESEHPLALQLGGANPAELAEAARIGAEFGYDEINFNLGCPSARVGSGGFGACLMGRPIQAARCVRALCDAVDVPVSVKCRTGVDKQQPVRDFHPFIDRLADAGCRHFIVHARMAWLQGLSPKQNRNLPPLQYDIVHRLKEIRPHLQIHINGGIGTLEQAQTVSRHLDGVMIGRAAIADPWMLAGLDRRWFKQNHAPPSRAAVLEDMIGYTVTMSQCGKLPHASLRPGLRHCMALYRGIAGGKAFRRRLNEIMGLPLEKAQLPRINRALADCLPF